jgi:hypothetical protein
MYLNILIAVPIVTYLVSYLYLAHYHGNLLLFNVIIHENGKYSFLKTLFYASHFLGHIPVLTVLAFLFMGYYLSLTGKIRNPYSPETNKKLAWVLIVFLILSLISSLAFFGFRETFDFIAGRTQGRGVTGDGGAWDLHLPSLALLIFFIPVYLFSLLNLFKVDLAPSPRGLTCLFTGFLLLAGFNYLFNRFDPMILMRIWTDPRYLAHAVRELATFPVTYFPIPLYFILKREKSSFRSSGEKKHRVLKVFLVIFSVIFLAGLLYAVWTALSGGIGELAQKPAFAHGGQLGIPYLLASHYFEHFLDTVYFSLLSLLLFGWYGSRSN